MSWICPQCSREHENPAYELMRSGKLGAICGNPDCSGRDESYGPVTPASARAPAAAPKPHASVAPMPPGNLVDQIKARLDTIAQEIARLEGLRTEHRQLTKMLKAAT